MASFLRPNRLSIALFILFLVLLLTPLAASKYFGFSTGFFTESQKYSDVFNRGVGHVFVLWSRVAFFSIFGSWLLSGYALVADSFGAGPGWFAVFSGTVVRAFGILLMLLGPFLYYVLSCGMSYSVKSDANRRWIMFEIGILVMILPVSFYSYAKATVSQIQNLGGVENCTLGCVFQAQQHLEPSIDRCRSQCNRKHWPSDDQRISCWNHCGDALEAARAECHNTCTSGLQNLMLR